MIHITESGNYQTLFGAINTWQLWMSTFDGPNPSESLWTKVAEAHLNENSNSNH